MSLPQALRAMGLQTANSLLEIQFDPASCNGRRPITDQPSSIDYANRIVVDERREFLHHRLERRRK